MCSTDWRGGYKTAGHCGDTGFGLPESGSDHDLAAGDVEGDAGDP